MSDESQSERIWRYAMQSEDATLELPSASAGVAVEAKRDDNSITSTDLSASFRPVVPKLQYHGLAESQSQTLDVSEDISEQGSKVQDQLTFIPIINHDSSRSEQSTPLPSRILESIILAPEQQISKHSGSTSLPALENGHVTGASPPRGASPIIGLVTNAETEAIPIGGLEERKEHGHNHNHNQRLLQRNKASSFHVRPQEPSSPPLLKRLNTMPPRLNRYAPRDIQPSSQDSFAGSPPRQDLNAYIKNSKVFNNLYLRRPGVDGKPGEVIEFSSIESSEMPLSKNRKANTSNKAKQKGPEEETEEGVEAVETASQLIQAALEYGLIQRSPTPAAAPLPIVLAKDTQSDHHPSEDDLNESKSTSGDDMEAQSDVQFESQPVDHSPASSSSFVLPRAPAMEGSESPQPTQPISQDVPSDLIIVSPHGITLGSMPELAISSIPIPEYRRLEFLQYYRNRNEIIPATPTSTVPHTGAGPSLAVSMIQPSTSKVDNVVTTDKMQVFRNEKGKEKDTGMVYIRQDRHEPVSNFDVVRRSERAKDGKFPGSNLVSTEIVPDSQEGQSSGTSLETAPASKPKTSSDEVVPDSQEEEQKRQQQAQNLLSSPHIPLAQRFAVRPELERSLSSSPSIPLIQTTNRIISAPIVRSPTPTPAAVKSPLRKGQLPENVTHIRGRGRPSSKGKQKAVSAEDMEANDDDDDDDEEEEEEEEEEKEEEGSSEENNDMAVDEEKTPETKTLRRKHPAGRKTRAPSGSKGKVRQKRPTRQKLRQKVPVDKVATRKRKSDSKLEQRSSDVSLPPTKRYRSSLTTPGPSVGAIELNKRVLARRQDDDSYFRSGTVDLEFTNSDSAPASFLVKFDDGYEELVDLEDMRFFQLEPGDLIEVATYKKNATQSRRATVLDTDRWQDDEVAQVHDTEAGPDGDDFDVNGRDIRVSEEQIRLQWNERYINLRTLCKDKEFDLPRRNKHLAGYAFIVTLPGLPKSKSSLERIIELSGGIVCEWHSIVSLSGTSQADGNRVVGKSSDVRLVKSKAKPSNLFCIADEPRTTPKFLIALALGVPCLSVDWVLAKISDSEVKFDWQAYILPAGPNPVTKMAASQNFDRMWWRDTSDYAQLLSQPPVSKPFAGKSFLCLGPSFILKSKEFGTYPRVLLAMGASIVQAVTDLKYLNKKGQVQFDYTVVDDDAELVSCNGSLGVNILWIKKCLITGIEGPVPWPE